MTDSNLQAVEKTKHWIEKFIIHFGICPFASRPFLENKIKYTTCVIGIDFKEIQKHFLQVVLQMSEDSNCSNSFIIINENCSFEEYLDIFYFLEELLIQGSLDGMFQLASFHPEYLYEGTLKDDKSNYRNRSPFPLVHILRVKEVEVAIEEFGDTTKISNRNIEFLSSLDLDELKKITNKN